MKIITIISILFSGCATMQLESEAINTNTQKAKIINKIIIKKTDKTIQAQKCADYLRSINAN